MISVCRHRELALTGVLEQGNRPALSAHLRPRADHPILTFCMMPICFQDKKTGPTSTVLMGPSERHREGNGALSLEGIEIGSVPKFMVSHAIACG